jgi:hypothetical protein
MADCDELTYATSRSSNPELAERAEQLAADRLIDYDITPTKWSIGFGDHKNE